jgi:hypothetical protein
VEFFVICWSGCQPREPLASAVFMARSVKTVIMAMKRWLRDIEIVIERGECFSLAGVGGDIHIILYRRVLKKDKLCASF